MQKIQSLNTMRPSDKSLFAKEKSRQYVWKNVLVYFADFFKTTYLVYPFTKYLFVVRSSTQRKSEGKCINR